MYQLFIFKWVFQVFLLHSLFDAPILQKIQETGCGKKNQFSMGTNYAHTSLGKSEIHGAAPGEGSQGKETETNHITKD